MLTQDAQLLRVLVITQLPVKVLPPLYEPDRPIAKMTPDRVVAMVQRYPGRYEWGGRKNRVRWVRDISVPGLPWQSCWRTTASAVFPPPVGYAEQMRGI